MGEWCIEQGLASSTPDATVKFDYKSYPEKISLLECYQGKSGWLRLDKIIAQSSAESQERLVFTVSDEQGNALDAEFAQKLFLLSANVQNSVLNAPLAFKQLNQSELANAKSQIQEENNALLMEKSRQITAWAKDQMQAAEDEIIEIKDELREKEKQAALADNIEQQIELQEDISKLRKALRKARNQLDDVQDEIYEQEMMLLKELKAKVNQIIKEELLFEIHWQIL